MSMDWNNLPAHLMDNVFSNCSYKELKCCLLVSRNWLDAVNSYHNDINCLHLDNVESLQVATTRWRRFKRLNINFNVSFSKIKRIYEEFYLKNNVKHLRMEVNDFDELVGTLRLTGNSLISLTLNCDYVNKPWSYVTVDELKNVTELNIEYMSPILKGLCHNFTNLHRLQVTLEQPEDLQTLQLLASSSHKTLREINLENSTEMSDETYRILDNLYLNKVKITNAIYAKHFPPAILNLKSLQYLELNDFKLSDKDICQIQVNMPNLVELKLKLMANEEVVNFTEIGIQKLWEMTTLKSLFISNVSFEKVKLFENPSLTVLALDNVKIDDNQLAMITRSTPNLKTLEMHMFQVTCTLQLATLKTVSEHLKSLERFVSAGVRWTFDENGNIPREIVFAKLTQFIIRCYYEQINDILASLRAPKLRSIEFSLCRYLNNQGLEALLENSPSLMNLKLELYEIDTYFDMELLSRFRNLRVFACNKCRIPDALEFLENTRLNTVAIDMSLYYIREDDMEEFLEDVQRIRGTKMIIGKDEVLFS